jgi:two-component system sensor histidine kinase KdpD
MKRSVPSRLRPHHDVRSVNDDRPDPDALIARLKDEAADASRARLRLFFGFAPGVGKTYRMLEEARKLKASGRDVVVGVVETHQRKETQAQLEGLPELPRRKIEYRGRMLEELDLDAALARKPEVLLVDELAHTNAPGSRHPKRWQDVLELLDAGIDVYTTVNVQHVESLNDVVAQITHIKVQETVPDSVLERADEIEVIDIAPEALLARLKEGKVYLPAQAERAVQHFFQRKNLLALRELALRRTAQHVDQDVLEYRTEHGVLESWPAGERILVCVGPSPSSDRLIRAAYRLASGLRAPWTAAYVESIERTTDRDRLEKHLRLAETLGGEVVRLEGAQIAEALLRHARKYNVTRILIGKPTHARLRDRLRGSLLDDVVRGSGSIDVQVIGGVDEKPTSEPRETPPSAAIDFAAYAGATLLVVLTTLIALGLRSLLAVPDLEVLYVAAVILAAVRLGRGPSVLTAALGVAAYDFFFVPPFLTFAVDDARYLLTFGLMFGVGLLVSELTGRIRRQERGAIFREQRTAALYALSRDLGGAERPTETSAIIARHAAQLVDGSAYVLLAENGSLREDARHPEGPGLDQKELGVARWALDHKSAAGLGTGTLPGSRSLSTPLLVGKTPVGVLATIPGSSAPLDQERRAALEALARQAAFALERIQLAEEASRAALRAKTEELRSSLLSTVSHDLRTPLAVITGAATTLLDETEGDETGRADAELSKATQRELLSSIVTEADRLERLVASLLDMTRLEAGAVALKREWVPLEELAVSALHRVARLSTRKVEMTFAPGLPLASVDPVLFEQLFLNLFENAAKYTPSDAPIEVVGELSGQELRVEVRDRGPGIPVGSEERIFEKFVRAHAEGGGVGLGLPICRAIATAHGGRISARNREGGGAIFTVWVPVLRDAPKMDLLDPA